MLYHVGFQIVAGNMHALLFQNGKIVVNEKGQIAFSAAEIQNGNLVLIKIRESVIYHLDEAVNLTEFIVFRRHDLSLLGEYAKVDHKGDGVALADQIILLTVVRGAGHGSLIFRVDGASDFSFFGDAEGNFFFRGEKSDLAESAKLGFFADISLRLVWGKIFMKGFFADEFLGRKGGRRPTFSFFYDDDFRRRVITLLGRGTQHDFGEGVFLQVDLVKDRLNHISFSDSASGQGVFLHDG